MNFTALLSQIQSTHIQLQQNVIKAVNAQLTIRNWLIGFYIVKFEQNGEDRAQYGSQIIKSISQQISIRGLSETNLKLSRQFYLVYPNLMLPLLKYNPNLLPASIRQSLPDEFQDTEIQSNKIGQSADIFTSSSKNEEEYESNHEYELLTAASFTHFTELIKVDSQTKRRFYELLLLKTQPSVSEFKKQINSLAFERTGISENLPKAFEALQQKIKPEKPSDMVKSHYLFDFLELGQAHLIEEKELEQALIEHLQLFITELGGGFCFEARQKRILIGDEYYFIDLVFYHRILKCHILIELKTEEAKHQHIGQLKTYLQCFKRNIQESDDNPPVGILLVTAQNKTLVEYAVADNDKEIFVSQYLLRLPKKEKLEEFINNELKKL